jgi:hypothetical protein
MNLVKHIDFFDPNEVNSTVHIIGVGAIGSHLAIMLVKLGIEKFTLYDFDTVESKNVTNQAYTHNDIGQTKLDAISEKMLDINPQLKIRVKPKGWQSGTPLSGYVFLAVDSIELRHRIIKENKFNNNILGMFDTRMGLTEGQSFGADWTKLNHRQNLLDGTDFTDEEAKKNQPVSACNSPLSVITLVWSITSATVSNFINLIKKEKFKTVIILDIHEHEFTTF